MVATDPAPPQALRITPAGTARTLAALVDTLLPGDDLFPPASAVGTQGLLAARLRERAGADAVRDLAAALGPGFADAAPEERTAAVQRLHDERFDLFALARMAAYTAYYAAPAVLEAIRAMGHVYNDAPQPRGYELRRFDPTPGVDLPLEPRGAYLTTDGTTRVDTSPLADLGLPAVWPPRRDRP